MITVLVIDDEHEVRWPWLSRQIQMLVSNQAVAIDARTTMPSAREIIEMAPTLICWDNDLGDGKETSNILHEWIWELNDTEKELVSAALCCAHHLIHSANHVRNVEIRAKLKDLGVPSEQMSIKSIAGIP